MSRHMRPWQYALMVSILSLAALPVRAGSFITVEELARRLGMTCTSDRLASRCTLTDGANEIVIYPGMYNVMVNKRVVGMECKAESRGGAIYVPDTVLGALKGHIRANLLATASRGTSSSTFNRPTPSLSYSAPSFTYPPVVSGVWKVVIDPGHGGKDPGAIGLGGLQEKAVNLGIGLALRDILKYRGFDVVMTRQDDTFVELEERANICNRHQGDVFISIHANASPNRSTTGSEIYFVDDQGPYTAIARGVAAASTMDINPRALGVRVPLDQTSKQILFGALLEEYRIESRDLAAFIRDCLGGNMISYGRGIYGNKGLRVLRFTRCPAVLVEVGFISNPATERQLREGRVRGALAEAIADGLTRFKAAHDRTAGFTR